MAERNQRITELEANAPNLDAWHKAVAERDLRIGALARAVPRYNANAPSPYLILGPIPVPPFL